MTNANILSFWNIEEISAYLYVYNLVYSCRSSFEQQIELIVNITKIWGKIFREIRKSPLKIVKVSYFRKKEHILFRQKFLSDT